VKPKAKTLADFRALHDPNVIVPNRIKAALAKMLAEGPDQWEYESDFIKLAQISQTQIGMFREQFIKHVVETAQVHGRHGRKVWFADPKIAAKARGE